MKYASVSAAARDIGITPTTIATAIKKGRPTLDGLHFEYCTASGAVKNTTAMSATLADIKDLLNNPQVLHNLNEFRKDLHDRNKTV